VKVAAAVGPGDEFVFILDFGDRWEHRCRVLAQTKTTIIDIIR
jgi:hypothetical protein